MGKTTVRAAGRLPLHEVSALCVRRGARGQELVAVGDELFTVVTAELLADGVGRPTAAEVHELLPVDVRAATEGSVVFVRFGRPRPDGRLTALRWWTLSDDDEADVESVNDIAVDARGRLHVVSSKSRRIFRLRLGEQEARIDNAWKLADEIDASRQRKPEGLAFDADGRPIVAVDTDQPGNNVFLLEQLEG